MTLQMLYYIEPISSDHFHLYNPSAQKCRRATLRGTLRVGPRSKISLLKGERVWAKKIIGTKKWTVMTRSRQVQPGVWDAHDALQQCDYSD